MPEQADLAGLAGDMTDLDGSEAGFGGMGEVEAVLDGVEVPGRAAGATPCYNAAKLRLHCQECSYAQHAAPLRSLGAPCEYPGR